MSTEICPESCPGLVLLLTSALALEADTAGSSRHFRMMEFNENRSRKEKYVKCFCYCFLGICVAKALYIITRALSGAFCISVQPRHTLRFPSPGPQSAVQSCRVPPGSPVAPAGHCHCSALPSGVCGQVLHRLTQLWGFSTVLRCQYQVALLLRSKQRN